MVDTIPSLSTEQLLDNLDELLLVGEIETAAYLFATALLEERDFFNVATGEVIIPDINADSVLYGFQTYTFDAEQAKRAIYERPEGVTAALYALETVPAPAAFGATDRLGWVPCYGIDTVVEIAASIAENRNWIFDSPDSFSRFLSVAPQLPDGRLGAKHAAAKP